MSLTNKYIVHSSSCQFVNICHFAFFSPESGDDSEDLATISPVSVSAARTDQDDYMSTVPFQKQSSSTATSATASGTVISSDTLNTASPKENIYIWTLEY